jgi:hypothetical protein
MVSMAFLILHGFYADSDQLVTKTDERRCASDFATAAVGQKDESVFPQLRMRCKKEVAAAGRGRTMSAVQTSRKIRPAARVLPQLAAFVSYKEGAGQSLA